MLAELGYTPKLTISIPKANHELNQTITNLNTQGCNILNLGIADYQTVLEQTAASSYCVFPSMSESLGLGIIESQKLGNKVLASNLPYVYQAVQPTAVFDPTSVESIVDCVVIALTKETPPTELRMQNQLKDWIAFVQMLD